MSRRFQIGSIACWLLALSACSDDGLSDCEMHRTCHGAEAPSGESGAGGDGSDEADSGGGGEGDDPGKVGSSAGSGGSAGNANGGNDGETVTPTVKTRELPRGRFDMEYTAKLAATGGVGDD